MVRRSVGHWRRVLIPTFLLAISLLGLILRARHLSDVPQRTPDEHYYVRYGKRVAAAGPSATATLFKEYLADPTKWNYPSPVRVGHTYLLASVMWLAEADGFGPGVTLSFLSSLLSLALVGYIGVRFFGPTVAFVAVILLSSSVIELELARRAWQDATVGLIGLLLLWFAMEILRSADRRWPYAALYVAGAAGVLMKQTLLITYAVAVLAVISHLVFEKKSVYRAAVVGLSAATSLILAGLLLFFWGGGRDLTMAIVKLSLEFAPNAAAYARSCCEGPWWQVPWVMLLTNPLQMILALIGVVSVASRLRGSRGQGRSRYVLLALAMTLALVVFVSVKPLLQNLRYLSPASGALALLGGYGASLALARAGRTRWALRVVLLAVLLFASTLDYQRFVLVCVTRTPQDLGAVQLRQFLTE